MVLLDLNMPVLDGETALRRIHGLHQNLPVIVLTAKRDMETLLSTMRAGAYDYISKPVERDRLLTTVRNAAERFHLSERLARLEHGEPRGLPGVVGQSPIMRSLSWQVERVAAKGVSVMIHGESGTGKELVARAIHELSDRKTGPFIALNCASIPESLQDTELFGHERGSFTGAEAQHIGRFEQAHGGTLFLDEIAELSSGVQSKLLRVLQERSVRRVGGGAEELAVDFRLIAASHRKLWNEVQAGRFREDLFFRLVVFEVELPPLRERAGDVTLLTRHFAELFGPELIGTVPSLSPEALAILNRHRWPGNVRELQNVIQRAIVACTGSTLRPSDLPAALLESHAAPEPEAALPPRGTLVLEPGTRLAEIERRAIAWALQRSGGNVSHAARDLGIARTTLYRKMKSYDLDES
jgi:DNA-binding NtrC family response regulator